MTYLAGRRWPLVSFAWPVLQPPSSRHSSRSSGPAARWIAPSTPPPPSNELLAALTMASTARVVMSVLRIAILSIIGSSSTLFLAVQHPHLVAVIARSRHSAGRNRRLDSRNLLRAELHLECAQALGQLRPRAGPNHRHDPVPLGQHPGHGQLHLRNAPAAGNLPDSRNKLLVPGQVVAAETREAGANVSRRGRLRARQQPPRQRPIRCRANAQFIEYRKDLRLGSTAHQRVLDLQVHNGMRRGCAPYGLWTHFGEPDISHIAGLHHIRDGPDRILNRDAGIQPRGS